MNLEEILRNKVLAKGLLNYAIKRNYSMITPRLRKLIFKRDDYQCLLCGKEAIQVHHLDNDMFNNKPENLASLCKMCHVKFTPKEYETSMEPPFNMKTTTKEGAREYSRVYRRLFRKKKPKK